MRSKDAQKQLARTSLNFQNFTGGACPRTPLVVHAFGPQLGRYTPQLSPPGSPSSTSTYFEKENPAQFEKEQGNQVFSQVCFIYWLRVQCFFFNKTVYRVLSVSSSDKKKNDFRVKFK